MPYRSPLADSAPPERPTSVRYVVLVLVALASSSAYLTRYCIAVAETTIEEELGFEPEQMGWVFGAFSLGYFLFQVPGGWLGNKFGTRSALAAISSVWSLCTVWTAMVSSLISMAASRAMFGLAQAGLVPLTAKVINDWFPLRQRGTATSVIGASMSLGGVAALALTSQLLRFYDWRGIFAAYSLVGIGWAAVFFWFFRTRPEQHQRVNAAERRLIHPIENVPEHAPPSNAGLWEAMVRSRTMWAINIQSALRAAGYIVFVTWMPAILEKRYEVSKEQAGLLATAPLLVVAIGSLAGGSSIDVVLAKTRSKWWSRSGIAVASLGICAALTFASAWTSTAVGLVTVLTASVFFFGFSNPTAWAATLDVAGAQTAVVMGVMNMAGTIGGFCTPVVVGYMIGDIEKTGGDWNQVIYLLAVIHTLCALSWLAVNPNHTIARRENDRK